MGTASLVRLVSALALIAGPAAAPAADRAEKKHAHGAPAARAAAKPARLLSGFGEHHHPIAVKSAEAQKFFDQGMALLYGFNHEEAIRSFERAAELAPESPMPLWGIGYALGPNINLPADPEAQRAAFEATKRALARAEGAPENERAYVEALAERYSDDPNADVQKLAVEFSQAMKELSEKYPDDLDAATLYAESLMNLRPWKLWTADGKPAEGTEEIVAVLESVLKREPAHLGANHYYIHATEASPTPERATAAAMRLEKLAPASGHLVHMPAHVWVRTGDYGASARSNRAAAEADEAYFRKTGAKTGVYPLMYYSHNLHFLAYAHAMEGRYAEAKRAAERTVKHAGPLVAEMPMIEFVLPTPLLVDLRFGRWDAVLAAKAPVEVAVGSRALWHYARGAAYAAKKDLERAEAERQAFVKASQAVPPEAMWSINSTPAVLAVALSALDGRIAAARGDRAGAVAAWTAAVEAQDQLGYDEPPSWFAPARESLGAALFLAGELDEAEDVFRADLARNPRSGRSLFGLWKTLEALGKDADAAWVKRGYEEAWKRADVRLEMEGL